MDRTILLLFGTALILAGAFGLVELAIRQTRRPAMAAAGRAAPRHMETEDSPSIAPTDEDLEMVVVRERETNPDGRPRQEIIKDLQVGDPVVLLPETPGSDGRSEIKVVATGGTIGYVPSAKVSRVLDILNEGNNQTHSEISHIAEAEDLRGVWINVSVWR
jgi:hypothetical protein